MGVKTFAAIDVGSYELGMKIYQFSPKNGMKAIDHIRHRIDLGSETYRTGKISYARVDELCRLLREFTDIMKSYQVDDYRAFGTSAVRETENTIIVLDQIRQRTGIKIEVLSNSEQRFLDYKSIASKGEVFSNIIEKGTAIVDIGGGSIQVSLFDKDTLVATQNMRLGVLRLQDRLRQLGSKPGKYEDLIDEMAGSQLAVFKKLYMKDRVIENIIIVDDYLSAIVQKKLTDETHMNYVDLASYEMFMQKMRSSSQEGIAKSLGIPDENVQLLFIAAVLTRRMAKVLDAKLIWAPGATLCDGIAYDYGESCRLISPAHDFEADIIACAKNISKRYMGSRRRAETLEKIALQIFDSMKRIHGLGRRERLLLRIATLLHDCGKYISLTALGECSYSIIMATEIIGLSHEEREIVANVVKYNHLEFAYYQEIGREGTMEKLTYLKIAKLTAILKIANGLDRSHKQKFKEFKTAWKDGELIITVNTSEDITLEKGMFSGKADFFEEVYSIRPVIRQKKIL